MRTFIFGAGASLHAGYPLASDLWGAMEGWARAVYPEDHPFVDAIDTMNAEFEFSKSFELVLTDLDELIESLLRESQKTKAAMTEKVMLVTARSTIPRMIRSYFDAIRVAPATLYEIFGHSVLSPGDAVITFNYDLGLDRELRRADKWSIGDGYGFCIPRFTDSPCKLYKLHGSTNWFGEPFGGLARGFAQMDSPPMGQRPVIQRSEFDYLGYENGSDPQCHDGPVRIESLIMPTANKKVFLNTSYGREWEGFWDYLWAQAATALRSSDEVYLIGYSIPEYDTRARDLIRSEIRPDVPIEVCCHNGTSDVVKTLRQIGLGRASAAIDRTFDGWIKSHANHGGRGIVA
jgi:hypothetical protein